MRAIIIDDMKDARAALRQDILDYCPTIEIVGEAESVVTGLKLLKNTETDIVFLDIELEDGIGFDILDLLNEHPFQVIFTTASQDYAIKAFEVAAIDYLLKPIDPDRLKEAVAKVDDAHPHIKEQFDIIKSGLTKNEEIGKIVLHTQEKIVSVPYSSISYCMSDGNYTTFFFTDGSKLLITKTLKEFDKILTNQGFLRTHQSYLINTQEVKEFVKTEGGYLLLKDDTRIPVSVRKRTEVLTALGMS